MHVQPTCHARSDLYTGFKVTFRLPTWRGKIVQTDSKDSVKISKVRILQGTRDAKVLRGIHCTRQIRRFARTNRCVALPLAYVSERTAGKYIISPVGHLVIESNRVGLSFSHYRYYVSPSQCIVDNVITAITFVRFTDFHSTPRGREEIPSDRQHAYGYDV